MSHAAWHSKTPYGTGSADTTQVQFYPSNQGETLTIAKGFWAPLSGHGLCTPKMPWSQRWALRMPNKGYCWVWKGKLYSWARWGLFDPVCWCADLIDLLGYYLKYEKEMLTLVWDGFQSLNSANYLSSGQIWEDMPTFCGDLKKLSSEVHMNFYQPKHKQQASGVLNTISIVSNGRLWSFWQIVSFSMME